MDPNEKYPNEKYFQMLRDEFNACYRKYMEVLSFHTEKWNKNMREGVLEIPVTSLTNYLMCQNDYRFYINSLQWHFRFILNERSAYGLNVIEDYETRKNIDMAIRHFEAHGIRYE